MKISYSAQFPSGESFDFPENYSEQQCLDWAKSLLSKQPELEYIRVIRKEWDVVSQTPSIIYQEKTNEN